MSEQEIVTLPRQIAESAIALKELRTVHQAMQGPVAFRTASKIWNFRNVLRG